MFFHIVIVLVLTTPTHIVAASTVAKPCVNTDTLAAAQQLLSNAEINSIVRKLALHPKATACVTEKTWIYAELTHAEQKILQPLRDVASRNAVEQLHLLSAAFTIIRSKQLLPEKVVLVPR